MTKSHNRATVEGRFIYDVETRALIFNFDDNQKHITPRLPHLTVIPQADGDYPCWQDENKVPRRNLPRIHLTFSGKDETKGLLIMVNELSAPNPVAPLIDSCS